MEIALDFALQAAPDHPWVAAHPEWFAVRPDGSIAYAENPPKKYQDIYPVNFDNDPAGIYAESLRCVLLWAEHGVRIFRVDNPHTKPPNFWHWLIWQVKSKHPDVLFLAEASRARPALFRARLGSHAELHLLHQSSSQSTTAPELRAYCEELVATADHMRPNFWPNTPDILHESLQTGGPSMFAIRATLAATMFPTWGVYSGFELFEGESARPGSEEYRNSEKYELRPRDFAAALNEGRSLELHCPAQRDPPRPPRAAAAARHPLPPHRQRPGRRLVEDGRQVRRHGAGGLHAGPDEHPDGQHRPGHARVGGRLERHPAGARRGRWGHLQLGPVHVRAAGAVARRRARPLGHPFLAVT
jgi:hypothetical protein